MSKAGKYVVGTLLVAGALFGGPKVYELYQEKKEDPKWKKEQAEYDRKRELEKEDQQYVERIVDSVVAANGFEPDSGQKYYYEAMDVFSKICDLDFQLTPAGALANAVFTAGAQIIERNMNKLVSDLGKYHLKIEGVDILVRNMCDEPEVVLNITNQDGYNNAFNLYLEKMVNKIDFGSYGDARKQEIKQIVENRFANMLSELDASRKNIEKSYAVYIAGGQKAIGIYEGDDELPGYKSDINQPYYVTIRTVSVYDSKLPIDFFGDSDAEYKLEQVAPGQWRAVKKYKNGKIAKTQVFQHNVEYKTLSELCNEKPTNDFYFYPGDNMGVHISVTEVVDVQTAEKQYKSPYAKSINKEIDSLTARRNYLLEQDKKVRQVYDKADSIAQIKLKQRIAQRTLSK